MAELLDITQNKEEARLRFMKKCGNDLYMWSSPDNESWEAIVDHIICVVGFSNLVNKREQFCFTAEDMARVRCRAQTFS